MIVFLSRVKARLNRFRFLDSFVWTLAVVASILAVVCLVYLIRGYAVPKAFYTAAIIATGVGTIFVWFFRLWSKNGAAHFADGFFNLKDSLSSSIAFREERRKGAFIKLQQKTTAKKVEPLNPASIKYQWPKRIIGTALALIFFSGLMAFKEASPAVLEKQRIESETTAKTKEINEFLEELVEELEKNPDDEENAALDPEEVKEWVKKLEETKGSKRSHAAIRRTGAEIE